MSLDIAPAAKGSSTASEAIEVFIRSRSAAFRIPITGWRSTDGRLYTSGTARLEMFRLPSGGWVVTGASICRTSQTSQLIVPPGG